MTESFMKANTTQLTVSGQWSVVSGNKQGLALLITVIIIGTAALIMALNASLLGLGELDLGYTSSQSAETFSIADGCVEDTLRHLRIDSAYSGGTLNVGDGSCIIGVASSGVNRIITVTSTIGVYNSVVQMDVDIDSENVISVNGWTEL
jgi:hypothetical protein